MIRCSFNGGELSPSAAMRMDLDVYHRGAKSIVNFDISQMGGIRRRRGMRYFADAMGNSRIFPYIYSTAERFLVEISSDKLRVYTHSGSLIFETWCFIPSIDRLRTKQVNSLLILTSPDYPVMVLKRNNAGAWTLEEYKYKSIPWREEGHRELPVTISMSNTSDYTVRFPDELPDIEKECCAGDLLRASYYTNQQDVFGYMDSLLSGVIIISPLSTPHLVNAGQKFAIRADTAKRYYSCTKEWKGADVFCDGLTSPENYPEHFLQAESLAGFGAITPIDLLTKSMYYGRGDKVLLDSGYWEYWTCIKEFRATSTHLAFTPENYPGNFVQGLAIGSAAPCQGTWKFYCSGAWVGEYEVRRSYDGRDLSDEWETLGSSFSRIAASSNTLLTGDEQKEECWLRLFITRSRYEGTDLSNGFPQDSCSNKLVVSAYKHDMLLKYNTAEDNSGGIISDSWAYINPIRVTLMGDREVIDWSWQAFSDKYGYPHHCEIYNQRLVLASTASQPQTIWMSATDDLNNFRVGKTNDAALALTMSTETQNPICWLMAQGARLLLGTSDAEWIISSGGNQSITYANARIDNHGYVGSADTPSIMATDKVVYFERGSGRLYQYGYDFQSDSYTSRDLTVFSDKILSQGGGVVDGCFLRKPDAKAFLVLHDGTAAVMTYNAMHEVHAWHRYTTAGTMEACASLPNGTESDSLYLIVQRADRRYIEVIDDKSSYFDNGDCDYISSVISNALAFFDASPVAGEKKHVSEAKIFLAYSATPEGVVVSNDGIHWDNLDRHPDDILKEGWHTIIPSGQWRYDSQLGIRVSGNKPFEILAIEA